MADCPYATAASCARRAAPAITAIAVLVLGLLPSLAEADERRRSGTDTSRHPPGGMARSTERQPAHERTGERLVMPSVRGQGATMMERVDPAVRQYWSSKCVQQRARGWGHTGDCNHPAYSGSGYGAAPVVVPYAVPVPVPAQPRQQRRPGHLNIRPAEPGGRGHLR